jgi:hypothetical protein
MATDSDRNLSWLQATETAGPAEIFVGHLDQEMELGDVHLFSVIKTWCTRNNTGLSVFVLSPT